mgnify:CR=1 FL=1
MVPAQVVNNSITRSNNFITIDKGMSDSIHAEMGVLNGNSIVGIVYQASAHYALVLPLLNSRSNISCKIQRTDYFGVLKWDGALRNMPGCRIFPAIRNLRWAIPL